MSRRRRDKEGIKKVSGDVDCRGDAGTKGGVIPIRFTYDTKEVMWMGRMEFDPRDQWPT